MNSSTRIYKHFCFSQITLLLLLLFAFDGGLFTNQVYAAVVYDESVDGDLAMDEGGATLTTIALSKGINIVRASARTGIINPAWDPGDPESSLWIVEPDFDRFDIYVPNIDNLESIKYIVREATIPPETLYFLTGYYLYLKSGDVLTQIPDSRVIIDILNYTEPVPMEANVLPLSGPNIYNVSHYIYSSEPRLQTSISYDYEIEFTVGQPSICSEEDTDGDGIFDDGDCSGNPKDNPCMDGNTVDCDDNCLFVPNPTQSNLRAQMDMLFKDTRTIINPVPADKNTIGRVRARSGQELEVNWSDITAHITFQYENAGGSPQGIYGECHFNHGVNYGRYEAAPPYVYKPDSYTIFNNIESEYITKTWWWNIDAGVDDNEQKEIPPYGLVDRYVYEYDVCNNKVTITRQQTEYPDNCTIKIDGHVYHALSNPDNYTAFFDGCDPRNLKDWRTVYTLDPPLESPETQAIFDAILQFIEEYPDPDRQMGLWPYPKCDFDNDNDCDEIDRQSLEEALGICLGEDAYNILADVDVNGCIEEDDYYVLFEQDIDDDNVHDAVDNCPAVNNVGQEDTDRDGVGDVCDNCPDDSNPFQEDTDGNGIGDVCDNHPPVSQCQDITVPTDPGVCSVASVSVDAGSSDPDGDPITLDQQPTGPYLLGTTGVTLTVTDDKGATDACTTVLTVVDQEAPAISVSVSPDSLWPVNHKLYKIDTTVTATDICDPAPSISLISVTSNESADNLGDGDTETDIVIYDDGTIWLRAERSGTERDRIYTITYAVTDASGNVAEASATVIVPHNM